MKMTGEDVLGTSMLNGLLKQIAGKDKRIAELEAALGAEHDARVRAERVSDFTGKTDDYNAPVKPHPLLAKETT